MTRTTPSAVAARLVDDRADGVRLRRPGGGLAELRPAGARNAGAERCRPAVTVDREPSVQGAGGTGLPVPPSGASGVSLSARLEALLPMVLGVAVGVLVALLSSPAMGLLLGWDTTAVAYVGWLAFVLLRWDAERTARRATATDPARVATDVFLLTAAVASLVTVGFVLTAADHQGGTPEFLHVGLGVASVVASWFMVHTLFTLRYAALYYGPPGGGVEFNSADPPTYRDFAYLAFTIGMTFQVSDTAIRSAAVRRTVLQHALLSYLFGTGILATTVNLVASLRSG